MKDDWRSYGPIASAYACVAGPAYFARPAADLVSLLGLTPRMSLLDVGTGSGVVLVAAVAAVGAQGRVIGSDPSLSMLLAAKEGASTAHVLAAALPSLPYRQCIFDAVTASFVLSHLEEPQWALREMARVLKPGGRLGMTSWARSPASGPAGQLWQEVAETFVDKPSLQQALERALPGEERFSDPQALRRAFRAAGLAGVSPEQRTYEVELATEHYVQSRLLSLSSRFLQTKLKTGRWEDFKRRAAKTLLDRFGEQLVLDVSVNFAIGFRP